MSEEKFVCLSDREHILLKPHVMVGSTSIEEFSTYIDGKLKTVKAVPALGVIAREIQDNSVDEFIRSGCSRTDYKIHINMDSKSLCVEDNGRGIPVEYHEDSTGKRQLRPVLCWTQFRSGTSFYNHETGPSANGVGSVCSNVFSLFFKGETYDGNNSCTVTCTNNMDTIDVKTRKNSRNGTKVYIEPDFKRFNVSGFSETDIALTKERLKALQAIYPEIKFTFNGERIKTKTPKEYISDYGEHFVIYENKNYFFGILPTEIDEYSQVSYIEGLNIKNGGSHENYITKELCNSLRGLINKKYKIDMTPNEIKRGFLLVFNGRLFPNLKFDSQVKERLVNSEAEVKAYLGKIDFDEIAKYIIKKEEIINPIIDAKLAKQLAAEKRANTIAQKKMNKQYVEKHIAAKSSIVQEKVLALAEGNSAISRLKEVRDVNIFGGYPLRGKCLNIYGLKEKDILGNKELSDMMSIIGLRFGMSKREIANDLNYGTIAIMTDQDLDGMHCRALLINFFSLWEELFKQHKVYIINSPIYIFTKNKGKKNEERINCYSKAEYEETLKKINQKEYTVRYIKGLGGLSKAEYKDMLEDRTHWSLVELDSADALRIMFDKGAVDDRRKIMEQ